MSKKGSYLSNSSKWNCNSSNCGINKKKVNEFLFAILLIYLGEIFTIHYDNESKEIVPPLYNIQMETVSVLVNLSQSSVPKGMFDDIKLLEFSNHFKQ